MEERSASRASGTTYHSFGDVELFEPTPPPRPPVTYDSKSLQLLEHLQHEQRRQQQHDPQKQGDRRPLTATKMQRQDSGYESNPPTRRASASNVARRPSNSSSSGGGSSSHDRDRLRNRPSIRRAAKSHPLFSARNSNQSLHLVRTNGSAQPATFFHFPSPDPIQLTDVSTPEPLPAPTPAPTPPPQTTHYWTSDRTRRLEYAAIDAATRGVKGWVMRHLVPDCFVPRENRHVSFDDDSGSVRRYRIDLEEEQEQKEKRAAPESVSPPRRRKKWRFWRRRKHNLPTTTTTTTII
ncbi:hypothetical protein G7046_g7979 [Stylonectria norvegica]|nr:hypothetical protein G7046_g7979 [Stylonectria norvegica]